jgi:hypothetical protein
VLCREREGIEKNNQVHFLKEVMPVWRETGIARRQADDGFSTLLEKFMESGRKWK